jgi:hypothetical protein
MSDLMLALKSFEAIEANLVKAEKLWNELQELFPAGVSFGENLKYEDRSRSFEAMLAALPTLDGWHPNVVPPDLNGVAETRFDLMELGDPWDQVRFESSLFESGSELRDYRFRFERKRCELIRDALVGLIDQIDSDLRSIREEVGHSADPDKKIVNPSWETLREHVDQIEVLLGSTVPKPAGWSHLRRHLAFAQHCDLDDIEKYDWPNAKRALRNGLYGANEPLPVDIADLTSLVNTKPHGPITTKLQWTNLDDDGFERLIFALIGNEPGYENPEWFMKTRAPDRGRDLSVTRVVNDGLSGTSRQRIIIQCKHWLTKSVALQDVSTAKDQMSLWGEPRVDVLVLATSGRFTADTVQWIERYNAEGKTPRIEMWPESHLERLLASRPALIAEFSLR